MLFYVSDGEHELKLFFLNNLMNTCGKDDRGQVGSLSALCSQTRSLISNGCFDFFFRFYEVNWKR